LSYRAGVFDRSFDTQRHVFGFVVASCVAALVAGLVFVVQQVLPNEGPIGALIVFLLMYPFAVMLVGTVAAVFGIPTSFLLTRLKVESVWTYVVAGFLIGTFTAYAFSNRQDYVPDTLGFFSAFGGASGAAWGAVWWLTARRPRHA
jgi:hypothetical protein